MMNRWLARAMASAGVMLCLATTARAELQTVSLQAEDAEIVQANLVDRFANFTGRGAISLRINRPGTQVEWLVDAETAGTYRIWFRYANSTGVGQPMRVSVNGGPAHTLAFAPTRSWASYLYQRSNATLRAGLNTIRLVPASDRSVLLDRLDIQAEGRVQLADWGSAIGQALMLRYPDPAKLFNLGWRYSSGLTLGGMHQVQARTHDQATLSYVRGWYDAHVTADGRIVDGATPLALDKLDDFLAGRLLPKLSRTADDRYAKAFRRMGDAMAAYPRTLNQVLPHTATTKPALWLDGTYMSLPFMLDTGRSLGPFASPADDAANALLTYRTYLQDSPGTLVTPTRNTGLLYHVYDVRSARRSPSIWCRGVGWYALALTDVLEHLPATHARRADLLQVLRDLLNGVVRQQDPVTGLWFQVLDKGAALPDNYLETSCSAMFTHSLSRAVERGLAPADRVATYRAAADLGFAGVMSRVSLAVQPASAAPALRGRYLARLDGISPGLGVGSDDAHYTAARPVADNPHGLGAFLMMYEQVNRPFRPATPPS